VRALVSVSLSVVVTLLVSALSVSAVAAQNAPAPAPAPAAAGASFDCGKATTPIEKTICADPALATLDGRLASVYAQAKKNVDAKYLGQARWLRVERNGCSTRKDLGSCLSFAYNERIRVLESLTTASVYASPANPNYLIAVKPLGQNRAEIFTIQLEERAESCLPVGDDPLPATLDPARRMISASDDQNSTLRLTFDAQYTALTAKTEGSHFCYGSIFRQVTPAYLDGPYHRVSAATLPR
jgi:uncharacterized protein